MQTILPPMFRAILAVLLLAVIPARAADEEARKAERQRSRDEQARKDLMAAHARMAKAVEVSVYLLGSNEKGEKPNQAKAFPIKPYETTVPIEEERILKGVDLQLLEKAWAALAKQENYNQGRCHFPAYGLRFRDAKGRVVFETSVCPGCSNYYIGTEWAALPWDHFGKSDFRKLLSGLFKDAKK
jgi:hypothetical protein